MSLLLWSAFSVCVGVAVVTFDISIQRLALALSVVLEHIDPQ